MSAFEKRFDRGGMSSMGVERPKPKSRFGQNRTGLTSSAGIRVVALAGPTGIYSFACPRVAHDLTPSSMSIATLPRAPPVVIVR
jgi:hypothetical protein